MKANELPIINFLQTPNIQFVIPVYQRNYDWKKEHCSQLNDDLIDLIKTKKPSTKGGLNFL